jgi:regulatory protein
MKEVYSLKENKLKIEHFCTYQERCHEEVVPKLWSMKMNADEIYEVIVHLIEYNFLNEARFTYSFARGKHHIKHWEKNQTPNPTSLYFVRIKNPS